MLTLREHLYRLELRCNRRLWPPARRDPAAFLTHVAGAIDPLRGVVPASTALAVVITTHARPAACARLLDQLAAQERTDLSVVVLEDPSPHDYSVARERLLSCWPQRSALYRAQSWQGKRGYHRIHDAAFAAVERLAPQLSLFLQDDVELADGALARALAIWHALPDPRKAALHLFASPDDEPDGRWIRFRRRPVPGVAALQTQWLDLSAFLAGPRFFSALDHRVWPVPAQRWRRDPSLSSGVGEQLTRRLFGRASCYQLCAPLVRHGSCPSAMNPRARALRPFDTRLDAGSRDGGLGLTGGWSLGEAAFAAICADARGLEPRTIVEFGSGTSSVRLAQAFPDACIFSIDDWPAEAERVRRLAHAYGVDQRVQVATRPLGWQRHAGIPYRSYQPGPLPPAIDALVIDGPPARTAGRGREACLHQAIGALRPGGRVYLDDYQRRGEQRIARNWLRAYPGLFRSWVLPFDHRVLVLEKLAARARPRLHAAVALDVSLQHARDAAAWLRRRLRPARATVT